MFGSLSCRPLSIFHITRWEIVNHLKRPWKILWQIKIGYCAFTISTIERDALARPLRCLQLLDLWIKWSLFVIVCTKPFIKIRIACASIDGDVVSNLYRYVALGLASGECTSETALLRRVKAGKATVV